MTSRRERAHAVARLGGYFSKIGRLYSRDHNVKVVMGPAGSGAAADLKGKKILLPAEVEFASPELRPVIEGLLDHETAHIAAEHDFEGSERASAFVEKALAETEGAPAKKSLLNSYEDARIERAHAKKGIGIERNLRFKNEHFSEEHEKNHREAEAKGERLTPHALFGSALDFSLRFGEIPEWIPDDIKTLARKFEDFREASDEAWCPRECWGLATGTYAHLKMLAEEPGPEGELAKKVLEGYETEPPIEVEAEGWTSILGEFTKEMESFSTYHLPHPTAATYDRTIVPKPDAVAYAKAYAIARPAIATLVKRLSMWLRAQAPEWVIDQEEGDIDEEALPYTIMGEKRVFKALRPGISLNTAWVVLVDQSGSMGPGDWDASKSYWTRPAAICLGEALHRCGIPFELWGWDTDEHTPVRPDGVHTRTGSQRTFQYKTFKDRWPRVRRRCSAITGALENDDTEAVYFAARRLLTRKEHHKVLLVLTDGYPTHAGVRGGFGGAWANKQLKETLEIVRDAGIVDIGVGINDNHVSEFYQHSMEITDLARFGANLVKLVKQAITGRG